MRNTLLKSLMCSAFLAGGLAVPATADSEVITFAREAAQLAGGARFCKMEDDKIEEYISFAEGRIAALAKDEYEKIDGAIEFKNQTAAAAAKAPKQGCELFINAFNAALRSL